MTVDSGEGVDTYGGVGVGVGVVVAIGGAGSDKGVAGCLGPGSRLKLGSGSYDWSGNFHQDCTN